MTADEPLRLRLLGEFALSGPAGEVAVRSCGQRLLAYLALHGGRVRRQNVAGLLWSQSRGAQAAANLRAALCRLPRPDGRALIDADTTHLALPGHLRVDWHEARDRIRDLRRPGTGPAVPDDLRIRDVTQDVDLLGGDLLEDWPDDWVLAERERHRQQRLHALEHLAAELCRWGRYADALSAGLAAVDGEPLRESSHRRVVEVHLAEGNVAEALRQYESYRTRLRAELGIAPSPGLRRLVHDHLGRPVDRAGPTG